MAAIPDSFPEAKYLQAVENEQYHVYRSKSDVSQILIRARRGGVLSLLEHIHLIASQDVQGYIQLDTTTGQCKTDLLIPLATLIVDDPYLRAENGLDSASSLRMITSTKQNMLESLEAKQYPFVQIHSDDCANVLSGNNTEVTLTIHGVQQNRLLPVNMQQNTRGQLIISGKFSILQSDFAIEPFSIFNGLIKVDDQLDFSYRLIFNRLSGN